MGILDSCDSFGSRNTAMSALQAKEHTLKNSEQRGARETSAVRAYPLPLVAM